MVIEDSTVDISGFVDVIANEKVTAAAFIWSDDGARMLTVACRIAYRLQPNADAQPLLQGEHAAPPFGDDLLVFRERTAVSVEPIGGAALGRAPIPARDNLSEDVLNATEDGTRGATIGSTTAVAYRYATGEPCQSRLPGLQPHALVPSSRADDQDRLVLLGDAILIRANREIAVVTYRNSMRLRADDRPSAVYLTIEGRKVKKRMDFTQTFPGAPFASKPELPFRAADHQPAKAPLPAAPTAAPIPAPTAKPIVPPPLRPPSEPAEPAPVTAERAPAPDRGRPSYLHHRPGAAPAAVVVPATSVPDAQGLSGAADASDRAALREQRNDEARTDRADSAPPAVDVREAPPIEILWMSDPSPELERAKRWAEAGLVASGRPKLSRRSVTGRSELPRGDPHRWLAAGRALVPALVEASCPLVISGRSDMNPAGVVVRGRVVPTLSSKAALEAAVALSAHLTKHSGAVKEAHAWGTSVLENRFAPPAQLRQATTRLVEAVHAADKKGAPLAAIVERELVRHRAYEEALVLGGPHLVARLEDVHADESLVLYAPAAASHFFPLARAFEARIAVTVHPPQDPEVGGDLCLRAHAVSRVFPVGDAAASAATGDDDENVDARPSSA